MMCNTMLEELHKQSKIICYNEDSSLLQGIHYFPNSGQLLVFSVLHFWMCSYFCSDKKWEAFQKGYVGVRNRSKSETLVWAISKYE